MANNSTIFLSSGRYIIKKIELNNITKNIIPSFDEINKMMKDNERITYSEYERIFEELRIWIKNPILYRTMVISKDEQLDLDRNVGIHWTMSFQYALEHCEIYESNEKKIILEAKINPHSLNYHLVFYNNKVFEEEMEIELEKEQELFLIKIYEESIENVSNINKKIRA